MDARTSQFYRDHGAEVARRYVAAGSAAARLFPVAFPAGSRVLDVGCGSGRDVNALVAAGCDAAGVDGSEAMLREATRLMYRLTLRTPHCCVFHV